MALASNARGIAAMCIAMACFVANDTLVKLATESLPVSQVIALRGVLVVMIILGALAFNRALAAVPRLLNRVVLLRSGLEAFTAFVFITALSRMGIAELTAIFLTAPLIMTAVSAFLYKETVGWRRWSAVLVGFVGMLIVVRPSPAGIDGDAVLGLLSAAGAVARDFVTRRVDPATPSLVVTLATAMTVTLLGFGLAPVDVWAPLDPRVAAFLAGAALFVAAGSYAVIVAFRVAEVSAISPFRYSVLVWALFAGLLVWGSLPDAAALIGSGLIVGSGLYVVHRERVRARAAAAALTSARNTPADPLPKDR